MNQTPPQSPVAPSEARVEAWSRYWSGGALHSCAGSFAGNYGGALRRFWDAAFAALPPAPRLLDLCCGNAPLAQLWLDGGTQRRLGGRFDAVDAARIEPPWLAQRSAAERAAVLVQGGVDVAALPFADASFDLCLSQYGVEYVGANALAEARRVLKPGGAFAAVLHHRDALPVRIAREELEHHAWLQASPLFERVAAMLEPMARAATAAGREALRVDAGAQAARSRFNAALLALEGRAAAARWPDLLQEAREACAAVLERSRLAGQADGMQALTAWRAELAASQLRQQELVDCALDATAVTELLAPLGDAQPRIEPLHFDNGELAGWGASARRA